MAMAQFQPPSSSTHFESTMPPISQGGRSIFNHPRVQSATPAQLHSNLLISKRAYSAGRGKKPIKFGANRTHIYQPEKTRDTLSKAAETAKELGAEGYQSALFNLMFLLQMRITKFMQNEKFDEELF